MGQLNGEYENGKNLTEIGIKATYEKNLESGLEPVQRAVFSNNKKLC